MRLAELDELVQSLQLRIAGLDTQLKEFTQPGVDGDFDKFRRGLQDIARELQDVKNQAKANEQSSARSNLYNYRHFCHGHDLLTHKYLQVRLLLHDTSSSLMANPSMLKPTSKMKHKSYSS